jgi:hypothetical protein
VELRADDEKPHRNEETAADRRDEVKRKVGAKAEKFLREPAEENKNGIARRVRLIFPDVEVENAERELHGVVFVERGCAGDEVECRRSQKYQRGFEAVIHAKGDNVVRSRTMSILRRRGQQQFISKLLAAHPQTSRRIIASLTTLPDRIGNLQPTLQCLTNQTRPPDEIVVAVPELSIRQKRGYVIPEFFARIPSLRVVRCETDWGPATKFIPAIQRELAAARRDTLVFVVDDDRIYPHDALETYLFYHAQFPDAALCFRGAPMPNDLHWRRPQLVFGDRIREPRKVAVVTGCGSYLIQPRFFDARLWDYSNAPSGAFYMDDIWISGWLDRRKIDKYVVPTSAMMRTVRAQRRTMTLHDVPNGRRANNNATIAYFADTWNVFSPRFADRFRKPARPMRADGS